MAYFIIKHVLCYPKSPNTSWFLAERECLFRRVKYLQALSCQIWELKWCLRCKSAGISLILFFHIIFMNYAHNSLLFIHRLQHRSLKLQIKTFFAIILIIFFGKRQVMFIWCLSKQTKRGKIREKEPAVKWYNICLVLMYSILVFLS